MTRQSKSKANQSTSRVSRRLKGNQRKSEDARAIEAKIIGRPSGFSEALGTVICERLIQGESLRAICRSADMPALSTVCLWLSKHEPFSVQYARAKEIQMEHKLEEIFEIADNSEGDITVTDGRAIVNHENIQRARLRVDTRKWAMSKLAPKKYGDRLVAEHSGPAGAPIQHHVQIAFIPATVSQD
jgi:hypothetical protein